MQKTPKTLQRELEEMELAGCIDPDFRLTAAECRMWLVADEQRFQQSIADAADRYFDGLVMRRRPWVPFSLMETTPSLWLHRQFRPFRQRRRGGERMETAMEDALTK